MDVPAVPLVTVKVVPVLTAVMVEEAGIALPETASPTLKLDTLLRLMTFCPDEPPVIVVVKAIAETDSPTCKLATEARFRTVLPETPPRMDTGERPEAEMYSPARIPEMEPMFKT